MVGSIVGGLVDTGEADGISDGVSDSGFTGVKVFGVAFVAVGVVVVPGKVDDGGGALFEDIVEILLLPQFPVPQ